MSLLFFSFIMINMESDIRDIRGTVSLTTLCGIISDVQRLSHLSISNSIEYISSYKVVVCLLRGLTCEV